jgi:hypothetical protein
MIRGMLTRLLIVSILISTAPAMAADPVVIHGDRDASAGLDPAPGVANIQVFRASRAAADLTDGKGWTYHHHVDLAAWKGRLYLAWNSTEKDEDVWPSRELFATSTDGVTWSSPQELFPMGVSTGSRMYFFRAPTGRMLAIAGLRTTQEQMTERKKGALVVREISADHTLGPVHVLRPPADPANAKSLPRFQDAADKHFVEACDQLLANKPFLEQADYGYLLDDAVRMKWHDVNTWPAAEPSRDEFKRFGKAMSFYHRKDGALVAVMKWGWVLVSLDEGETWSSPVRPGTFISGMAKAWGQRTADDRYALVYNPHLQHRYPLVIVQGDDGIDFRDMRTVHADVPPLRYPGLHKSPGPQYIRGISEWSSDGSFKDAANAMWVCYSVNKEDIWVSRIALPLGDASRGDGWNTYSPKWASAAIRTTDGAEMISLKDRDPADYPRATRLFAKPATLLDISIDVRLTEGTIAPLHIDFVGPRNDSAASFTIKPSDLLPDQWRTMKIPVNQPTVAIATVSFRIGDRSVPASIDLDRPGTSSHYEIRNVIAHPR